MRGKTPPPSPYGSEILGPDMAKQGNFLVELSSVGNPDLGQNPDAPLWGVPSAKAPASTLSEAAKLCRDYIVEHDLGGGNWSGGAVFEAKAGLVARISYNGRVWMNPDLERTPPAEKKMVQRKSPSQDRTM